MLLALLCLASLLTDTGGFLAWPTTHTWQVIKMTKNSGDEYLYCVVCIWVSRGGSGYFQAGLGSRSWDADRLLSFLP